MEKVGVSRAEGVNERKGETVREQRKNQSNSDSKIRSFRDLNVYQNALDAAMEIYEISKSFPPEERFSLTDQFRRSSRSVCANIGEGWRKRRYQAAFISKLNDSEGEAAETQVWLDISLRTQLISEDQWRKLNEQYEIILGQLVKMISEPQKWCLSKK
jgi:four helix bundle protein